MKTTLFLLSTALVLGNSAFAQIPSNTRSTPAKTSPTDGTIGSVMLLDNYQLIEGEISKSDKEYSIRRGNSEVSLPSKRVIGVFRDRAGAYQLMRNRANLFDADERLRVSRWCLLNGMRTEALSEAQAALRLRPNDSQAKSMVNGIQRLMKSGQTTLPDTEKPVQTTEVVEETTLPNDFNQSAYGPFAVRVQPLLMNTCLRCHRDNKGGSFHLTYVQLGTVNRRATIQNLQAVLKQINKEKIATSPLLVKSISPHGEVPTRPIRENQMDAFRMLERWVGSVYISEEPVEESRPVIQQPMLPVQNNQPAVPETTADTQPGMSGLMPGIPGMPGMMPGMPMMSGGMPGGNPGPNMSLGMPGSMPTSNIMPSGAAMPLPNGTPGVQPFPPNGTRSAQPQTIPLGTSVAIPNMDPRYPTNGVPLTNQPTNRPGAPTTPNSKTPAPMKPTALPMAKKPVDEFDPDIFNQEKK